MKRWVVKIGNSRLNVLHPQKEKETEITLKTRALKFRDAWVESGIFPSDTISIAFEEI